MFAIHQDGGFNCIEVFFFRTGQNWGNRAYFPKADRDARRRARCWANSWRSSTTTSRARRVILLSHEIPERALLAEALSAKSGRKVEISVPQRGEKKELVEHALVNAREALGRKLAETSSQQKLLKALAETFGLPRVPRRIEVYDNSHIQGTNAVGAMIVAGPEGFHKNQYRKFNIRSAELTPGDDLRHDARDAGAALQAADRGERRGRRSQPMRTRRMPVMRRPRATTAIANRPGPIWC